MIIYRWHFILLPVRRLLYQLYLPACLIIIATFLILRIDICTCMLSCFSHVQLFATPWTVAHQAPLSMGFPRQEYWSRLLCPSPGDIPHPRIELVSLMSPALADGFFTTSATWEYTRIDWYFQIHWNWCNLYSIVNIMHFILPISLSCSILCEYNNPLICIALNISIQIYPELFW